MATTLRDVAGAVGLSIGIVSKVLNERPGTSVAPETRRRIRQAADRLGYAPHAAARALRRGKTQTIALLLSRATPLFGVAEALAECLGAAGYDLLIKVFPHPAALRAQLEPLCRSHACDACLLWGREADVEAQGQVLEQCGMPFVVKGRHEERHPDWLQIDFDHEAMMAAVVRRLAERGHRRIAYLGYDADEVFRYRLRDGFIAAMKARLGRSFRGDWIAEGPSDPRFNEAQILRWLALPPEQQPTALAIGAGNAAWEGTELALARAGRRIGPGPAEMAVAGVSSQPLTLLFGHGDAYQEIELSRLAQAMCHQLLLPLLAGETPAPVVRMRPELRPLPSRELGDAGLFSSPFDGG